jgi:1-acyl-sn-glycerol-3-phosphate acyltransferase
MDVQPEPVAPSVDLTFLTAMTPPMLRSALPGFLAGFVVDSAAAKLNKARVTELVAGWSDDTCNAVVAGLAALGREHRPYPAIPACRELSRVWCRDVILAPEVVGAEHLAAAVARGPTLVCCNHLSYIDSSATDAVLAWAGHADLADRLIAAAGPKVYQDLFRLIAAACLNTLPVPQSTSFTHTEKLSARELMRRANESLAAAAAAMSDGYVLLLYPEGSRSRTGQLGSFLRGVYRWFGCVPDLSVVPLAISGTEQVMPIGRAESSGAGLRSSELHAGPVRLAFGRPLVLGVDGTSRDLLVGAHAAVAALLPPHLAPDEGTPATA